MAIKSCTCAHAGQDALHGKGMRVMNQCGMVASSKEGAAENSKAAKKAGVSSKKGSCRCTVCGKVG